MGLFTTEAKARRKKELKEQHKKMIAEPPPYTHTPTHALKDSLQSVPDVNWGTEQQRLEEAHRHRLERETSALATGSDTNAKSIPANYWQGRPLPAQFKAPTPAGLRKLALSRPSLRGKKIALPETLPAKKKSQKPADDEGYASGHELQSWAKRSRKPRGEANASRQPVTAQPQKDEAAEAAREAELERLRNRVKELEAQHLGKQYEHVGLAIRPTVLTRAPANNASSPKPPASSAGSQSTAPQIVGPVNGAQGGTSSSSRWGSQSSEKSSEKEGQKKDESTPPSTPPSMDSDGVVRYDWAMHWARCAARTDEERDKLPPAVNPQERMAPDKAPEAKADPQPYDSFRPNFSRKLSARPRPRPRPNSSNSSRGHQSARTSEGRAGYLTDGETRTRYAPTDSEIDDLQSWI